MEYMRRRVEGELNRHLARGKSVLLLGPRQTGKTTLLNTLRGRLTLSLDLPSVRQRYEKDPSILLGELEALPKAGGAAPLVLLDEVQRVPQLLDVVQHAIDRNIARFVLTGSSARKLRRGRNLNLLPGRFVHLRLDPLTLPEIPRADLQRLLEDGSLPGIWGQPEPADRERDLRSYVEAYLEQEVRSEALARNVGTFARFLELAGAESGNLVSFRAMSQDLGVSHTTIAGYYEILEDCLVAERVDPLTRGGGRRRLIRSSRYLIFDLGVRRLCAGEGRRPGRERLGQLFEQWVGLELLRLVRSAGHRLRFWRDANGPEVDWVIETDRGYLPIEVKWTDTPGRRDTRHLELFLSEHETAPRGWVVCRCPRRVRLAPRIEAVPWHELASIL